MTNFNIYNSAEKLLKLNFDIVSHKDEYPYGRYRGDVKATSVYRKKNDETITHDEMKTLFTRDVDSNSKTMAALSGVYKTLFSTDNKQVTVIYSRHTAG